MTQENNSVAATEPAKDLKAYLTPDDVVPEVLEAKEDIPPKTIPNSEIHPEYPEMQVKGLTFESNDLKFLCAAMYDASNHWAERIGEATRERYLDLTLNLKQEVLDRVVFQLEHLDSPSDPKHLHDSWYITKLRQGWTFGAFSTKNQTHPQLRPFTELTSEGQVFEYLHCGVIRTLVTQLSAYKQAHEENQ